MGTYRQKVTSHTKEDAQGNITVDTTEETLSYIKSEEPEYIKLYTDMWCKFNNIPVKYHRLFFALVSRMTYANLGSPTGGQIVHTIGTNAKEIMEVCEWTHKDSLYKGLQTLCNCNAIKKLSRGEYQINPQYAGKGPWKYNKNLNQGGIADLIAKFSFKDKNVQTQIIWASDDPDEIGDSERVIATHQTITPVVEDSAGASAGPTDNEN